MGSRRVVRGLVALTVLTSFVAACGDDDDDDATPVEETDDGGAAEEVEAQQISVTGIDYAFSEAPTELDAGLVELTFANEGEVEHEAAFIEIGDTPLEEFLPKFDPVFVGEGGGPIPAEAENVAAPVEVGPGESATVTFALADGTYALICTFDGDAEEQAAEGEGDLTDGEEEPVTSERLHYNRGMARVVTVNPGAAVELPEADGTITASDYTFDADVEAGDKVINFENAGPSEIHFTGISSFDGTDAAAVEEAFVASLTSETGEPPEGAPEPDEEDFAFSGVFSSGLGSHIELEEGFESGKTYLLVCFLTDRAGGPPHALPEEMGGHGMYKVITVE